MQETIDLTKLVDRFGNKISQLAHRMILNKELAKEAAQEVWFEVIKSVESFRQDSDISTWIYVIAKRTILRYAKNERILKNHEMDHHFNLGQIEYCGKEEEMKQWVKEKCDYCLTAFCHCLNNEARLIFLLRNIAELPDVEVSEIMEMSEDNVRKIASRSFKKVKSFMERDCILLNPEGNCRCRIRKQIYHVELQKEYFKLEKGVRLINLFKKFDQDLPRKNYWEKLL